MAIDLTGCRLKIERAEEHFHAFDAEWLAFFQPDTKPKIIDHAFDGTWHVVFARPPFERPMPPRLSLICGDIIHNLRCALDHLVWQLVLAGGNKPGRWNSFPIYTDAKDFNRDVRSRKKSRGRGPLEGIDPRGQAWARIEQAQPYYSRNPIADPLAMLNMLDVTDKHRTLFAHLLIPEESTIWNCVGWNPAAELLEYRVVGEPLSLERDTEILRLRFSETGANPQVRVQGNMAFEPTFGNVALQVPLNNIATMPAYVRNLIEGFLTLHNADAS